MIEVRPKVLVVPEGGLYLAFRLLPILCRAGLDVELLCVRGDPVARSRYASKALLVESKPALFLRLKELMTQADRPWRTVIVANEILARKLMGTGDSALLTGWQPAALLPEPRQFFLGKFGLVMARDKWSLPIPESRVCENIASVLEFGDEMGWPVMIKPPDQSGGGGVMRLDGPNAPGPMAGLFRFPVLAQRFIRGRTGVVDMVCSQGRVLAWLASYSIRKCAGGFGPSSARLFQAMPALAPVVEQVAVRTGFEGFCGFDWIEEEATGRRWLTEFHPRPSSGFRFGKYCGVDFAEAVRRWMDGAASHAPALTQAPGRAVAAHYFSGDLMRCLREREWAALKAWMPGSGTRHDVFWDDWPLMASWVWQRLTARWKSGKPSMAEEYELADAREL